MLLPRLATAAVGIPFILWLVHLGGLPWLAFSATLAALALHEYGLVLWLGGRGVQRMVLVSTGTLLALGVALSGPAPAFRVGPAHLAATLAVSAVLLRELFRAEHSIDRAALTLFGAFFIGWTLGHLPLVRGLSPHGEAYTFTLLAGVWAADTAAYAVGLSLGKHRLAPVVSPKKSWEGSVGGLLGALLVVLLMRRFFLREALSPGGAVLLGCLVGAVSQLSDLSQSLVKRAAGVKDSSSILPGHGGVFDRMDSLLLLTPLYYWSLLWLTPSR